MTERSVGELRSLAARHRRRAQWRCESRHRKAAVSRVPVMNILIRFVPPQSTGLLDLVLANAKHVRDQPMLNEKRSRACAVKTRGES